MLARKGTNYPTMRDEILLFGFCPALPVRFLRRIRAEKLRWLEFFAKPRAGAQLSANITIKRGENVTEPRINCWFVPPTALFLAPGFFLLLLLLLSSSFPTPPSLSSHLHASLPSPPISIWNCCRFTRHGNRSFPRKIFILAMSWQLGSQFGF